MPLQHRNKLLGSKHIQNALKALSAEFKQVETEGKEKVSPKSQLEKARKNWIFQALSQKVSRSLQAFLLGGIDASSGSSGFLAPKYVEKKLKSLKLINLVDYTNHTATEKLVGKLGKYCIEENILPAETKLDYDIHGSGNTKGLFALAGYGTHHLFNLSMPHIIKSPNDVVIVTEPTYGLLLDPIFDAGGKVVSLPLNAQNRFKPVVSEISSLIIQTNKKLQKDYITQVENNLKTFNTLHSHPLQEFNVSQEKGKIVDAVTQSEAQTNIVILSINQKIKDSVLYRQNKPVAKSLLLTLCPKVRGFFNINPHTPLGTVLEQDEINELAKVFVARDVCIIDDLTHRNIRLDDKEPGTFAKSSAAKQTLTLISISKDYGLAAVRAGMAIGPKDLMSAMGKLLFKQQCMISAYSKKALSAVFGMPQEERQKYIAENNAEYRFRKDLTIALMSGIDAIESAETQDKIRASLNKTPMKSSVKSSALEGISGLKLVVNPSAAYFCLFDLSAFQGKYLGDMRLNASMDFRNAFRFLTDLEVLPGELNYQFSIPNIRFCLTMSEEEIIEAMLRIKNVLSLVTEKPLFKNKQDTQDAVIKQAVGRGALSANTAKTILYRFRPREESGYTKGHKLGEPYQAEPYRQKARFEF